MTEQDADREAAFSDRTLPLLDEEGMTAVDYFAAPGLSNSGMQDLAVSPLRYWHLHVNPNRPEVKETAEMKFGTALHCAVLEPTTFMDRYARELDAEDIKNCLVTVEDMRIFLREAQRTPKGTKKADLIAQVQEVSRDIPILEVMEKEHAQRHAGKIFLHPAEWMRVQRAADSLLDEPEIQRILSSGKSEVAMFATDPNTGVPLKARMDWVRPGLTLDIKTFTQKRGKSIDESIADALFYEGYLRQAWFYTFIRGLRGEKCDFLFAFVESEAPYEVRIKRLRPQSSGIDHLYWSTARIQVDGLIRLYADCVRRFGERPWREHRQIDLLLDENIRQLAY